MENLMQLIAMMKNGANPEEFMLNFMQTNLPDNPLFSNLLMLAQNKDTKGIEAIARNMAKQKGIDFDKEFNNFKQLMGFK